MGKNRKSKAEKRIQRLRNEVELESAFLDEEIEPAQAQRMCGKPADHAFFDDDGKPFPDTLERQAGEAFAVYMEALLQNILQEKEFQGEEDKVKLFKLMYPLGSFVWNLGTDSDSLKEALRRLKSEHKNLELPENFTPEMANSLADLQEVMLRIRWKLFRDIKAYVDVEVTGDSPENLKLDLEISLLE